MKQLLVVALVVFAYAVPSPSSAQVFGQFTPGETLPVNGHVFGAYLHASESFLGVLTQLRLSFYPDVDFGFQGGLTRIEFGTTDVTTIRIGGDIKYLAARSRDGAPADLAIGAALGVETGDDISILTLGPSVVASRPVSMGSNAGVTPFASVGLLFSNLDVLGEESTDFVLPFRLGAEFRLAPELRLMTELQFRVKDSFNDDVSFVTGVHLPF